MSLEVAQRPSIETIEHDGVRWLMVERPGPVELQVLETEFGLHPLHLDDLVSKTERPKIEEQPTYVFVVLHFPVLLSRPQRLAAGELHLIVGADYLITVHDGDLRPLLRTFESLRDDPGLRTAEMMVPGRLAYEVVLALVAASDPWTIRLSTAIDDLQEQVFGGARSEVVRQLALVRREVIQLRRMVRAGAMVIARLGHTPLVGGPELRSYWTDASDQIGRLADYLDDVWQTLEALSHSYDQLSTERMNILMRALTGISTVMLPLAVISGIYGMNIRGLPVAESEWAFEILLGVMAFVAVSMIALFRRRRRI